jgi:hypothetical protein
MSLRSSIQEGIKEALKAHDQVRVGTLRFLFASIVNKEKEKRYKLSKEKPNLSQEQLAKQSELQDQEVLDVVVSEAKKHKESIEAFEKGGRKDLVEKEQKELEVLKTYLPEQLSEEAIRALAKGTIAKLGATGSQDLGRVMGALVPQTKGKADGSTISNIVKELLTSE